MHSIPISMIVAVAEDGLLFSRVQVYSPPVVTVRVCVYCAVTGSSNTVSVPSVTVVVESLVQVTVVAGPPVEIQVSFSWSESNITSSPNMPMSPIIMIHCVRSYKLCALYLYHWCKVPHRQFHSYYQCEYHSDRCQLV